MKPPTAASPLSGTKYKHLKRQKILFQLKLLLSLLSISGFYLLVYNLPIMKIIPKQGEPVTKMPFFRFFFISPWQDKTEKSRYIFLKDMMPSILQRPEFYIFLPILFASSTLIAIWDPSFFKNNIIGKTFHFVLKFCSSLFIIRRICLKIWEHHTPVYPNTEQPNDLVIHQGMLVLVLLGSIELICFLYGFYKGWRSKEIYYDMLD